MGFCTNCGGKLDENHRFCASCGNPVDPPKESNLIINNCSVSESTDKIIDTKPRPDIKQQIEMYYDSDSVDRKTLFDDGMLVLSSKDLILYASDEKDELKRISISSIQSCGYSTIRRGLMIKRRVNEEDNFQNMLTQKHVEFADLKSKKNRYDDQLRQTRIHAERQKIKEKISTIENSLQHLASEIKQLEYDPTKIKLIQEKVADIQKEIFKLPKSFESTSDKTTKEEYRIWEYVINRRVTGISKIKIDTLPYDAVVTIHDRIFGTTPLTIDKPLIDDAILEGKYHVKLLKEGVHPVEFKITTDLGKGSFIEKIELSLKDKTDFEFDKQIEQLRDNVPDRSIDLSFHKIEREIEGKNELLLLTKDEILVMTKDKEQCLFEISYGSINEARFDKGFFKRGKDIKINYNEKHFRNLEFNFWIDDNAGKISASEIKQRTESLSEILNKKRKESKILDIPNRIRAPNYFIVTEKDIENNFSRFEPFEFERLVAKLFEKKGYKTSVTQERGDFGVDVLAEAGKEKIAIQVKHWQASVGGPDVHKTLGSMITFGANRAMVVTSSDFTNQAYEIQKRGAPIELWNGSKLRDEFRQYLLDAINEARKNKM